MRASLFDIQVNGFAGVDFQSPRLGRDEARRAVDALARHETLRFFPTFITDEPDRLEAKLANFEKIRAEDPVVAAAACGYHIEGPWLSPQAGFRGAHRPELMRAPDLAVFDRLQKAACGRIKLVTLAPEWEGSAPPATPIFISISRCRHANCPQLPDGPWSSPTRIPSPRR